MKNTEKQNDALLTDLDESIEKALDERMPDLAGALFRLQGSAKGWCNLEDCGGCRLAPLMCVNGIEERVAQLIENHHVLKQQARKRFPHLKRLKPSALSSPTPVRRRLSSIPVAAYFDRLQDILSEKMRQPHYTPTDHSESGHKLRWQRVNDAFLNPFPTTSDKDL